MIKNSSSYKILFAFVLIIGIVLTIFLLRNPQDLRERATGGDVSIMPICSSSGTVSISASFKNTKDHAVDVLAKDERSGLVLSMGEIQPGVEVTTDFEFDVTSIDGGSITFSDNDGTTYSRSYSSYTCTDTAPSCAVDEAQCIWDEVSNTTNFKVKIIDKTTNKVIKDELVDSTVTKLRFPAVPGGNYECEVIPVNSCGDGETFTAEGSCPLPSPTPIDTPVITDNFNCIGSIPNNSVVWDDEESIDLTEDVVRSYSENDTAIKCQYHCDDGFSWNGTSCIKNTYNCIGGIPANGNSCPGDDAELTENISWSEVAKCDTTRKCQYTLTQTNNTPTITQAKAVNNPTTPTTKVLTPTAMKELPPTGLTQDMIFISIIGSTVLLFGTFIIIFLW